MKRWIVRLVVLAVLVAVGWVLKQTVLQQDPIEVQLTEAAVGDVESTVTNSRAGTLRARHRATLSTSVGGRVIELPFSEGDRVEEGDLLLRLSSGVARASLELGERRIASAEARLAETCLLAERAEQELRRNEELRAKSIVSEDVLDEFRSLRDRALLGCETARAGVAEARADRDLAEARLRLTELRAPFAGVLAQLDVELGEYVTPSPPGVPLPSVVDLIDPGSLYVSAPMDEVDSARIAVGMDVRVTVDSFRGEEFRGRVTRIAPFVLDLEKQNRTVDIEVELAEGTDTAKMLPGTSSDVEVILRVATGVLRVPTGALLEGGRVLVLAGDHLEERRVEVGLRNWNWTEVTGGLSAGERVVTSLGSADVVAGAAAVPAGDGSERP